MQQLCSIPHIDKSIFSAQLATAMLLSLAICAIFFANATYNTCKNGCRYCYANHSPESVAKNCRLYDANAPAATFLQMEGRNKMQKYWNRILQEPFEIQDKYKLALELFDVRLMLEPEIAALAAEYATEEELKQLEQSVIGQVHYHRAAQSRCTLPEKTIFQRISRFTPVLPNAVKIVSWKHCSR